MQLLLVLGEPIDSLHQEKSYNQATCIKCQPLGIGLVCLLRISREMFAVCPFKKNYAQFGLVYEPSTAILVFTAHIGRRW